MRARVLGRLISWLAGGSGGVIAAAGNAADKLTTSDEERMTAQGAENANARAFAAPVAHGTWFDALVDGLNRLPRPVVTGYVFGGIAGWWTLPDLSQFSPEWLYAGGSVLGFWFGGRLLSRDLPAAVLKILGSLGRR